MATTATGTPPGICTMASKLSMPFKSLVGSGTPITGSMVQLASTPGRWAAAPAPQMMTSIRGLGP